MISALPIECIPCLFEALFKLDLSIIFLINSLLTKILRTLYLAKDDLKSVSRMDRHKSPTCSDLAGAIFFKSGLADFFHPH